MKEGDFNAEGAEAQRGNMGGKTVQEYITENAAESLRRALRALDSAAKGVRSEPDRQRFHRLCNDTIGDIVRAFNRVMERDL